MGLCKRLAELPDWVQDHLRRLERGDERYREVLEQVWWMRESQRRYFQTRDRGELVAAKGMEEQVDRLLESLERQRLFTPPQKGDG